MEVRDPGSTASRSKIQTSASSERPSLERGDHVVIDVAHGQGRQAHPPFAADACNLPVRGTLRQAEGQSASRKRSGRWREEKGFTGVMVVHDEGRVVGYYGLAPTAVVASVMPRTIRTGQPPSPVPCLLLGQLATDSTYVGQGVGTGLVKHALALCVAGARLIGGRALIVNALDEAAAAFWQRRGFLPSKDDRLILFRSIPDIAPPRPHERSRHGARDRGPGRGLPAGQGDVALRPRRRLCRQGRGRCARREAAQIVEISQTHDPDATYPPDVAFVANDTMAIARHVVEARIAQADGDLGRSIADLETAVQIQDSLAYPEPPFWYYPVRQSLGERCSWPGVRPTPRRCCARAWSMRRATAGRSMA
jgi:GNAT superfamily N-acetyltransferase